MTQELLFVPSADEAGAVFDASRTYRYRLWRRWGTGAAALWIMLNPSTADERELDPTLRRCKNYSLRWGYPAMEICNLYAYRSTDPKGLDAVSDPVGPDNLVHIDAVIHAAAIVLVAWGSNAKPAAIAPVVAMLQKHGVQPHCLKNNADGHPSHPLYLPKGLVPVPWRSPHAADG